MSALGQKRTHAAQQKDHYSRLASHACVIVRLVGTVSLSHPPCTADDCANASTAPGISTYRTDDRATRCAPRCSCCRGRRTSCVASISCATLRFRLGYRVIRHDYRRDGDSKKYSQFHLNLPALRQLRFAKMISHRWYWRGWRVRVRSLRLHSNAKPCSLILENYVRFGS